MYYFISTWNSEVLWNGQLEAVLKISKPANEILWNAFDARMELIILAGTCFIIDGAICFFTLREEGCACTKKGRKLGWNEGKVERMGRAGMDVAWEEDPRFLGIF